jgi:hypothetical protein
MQGRDSVLFWGFIDNALDLGMIERMARSLRARSACGEVLLVGPTQTRGARARISVALAAIPNLRIMDPKPLSELPLERMFAALLPYRRNKATDAVTLANKSMRMLACGLPLLITGMPNFLRREFIVRADEECDPARALERCRLGFLRWQPAIRDFCAENGPEAAIRTLGFA